MGSPHITSARHREVCDLHAAGMTSNAIHERTRLSLPSVWRILRANGLTPHPPNAAKMIPHESTRVSGEQREPSWHEQVRAGERRRIARGDNIMVGATAICAYLKITAITTLERWVEQYGFPAIKRPDGRWMSSTTAIDEWIWIAAELHAEGKTQLSRIAARAFYRTPPRRKGLEPAHTYTSSNIEREARRGRGPELILLRSRLRRSRYWRNKKGHKGT